MKFYTRLKVYKSANVQFNPDSLTAYSYDWWKFVGVIKGKVVFNNYHYSPSTSKHQSKVRSLMHTLGIKIDLTINMPESLEQFRSCALAPLHEEMLSLEIKNKAKGAQSKAIASRLERIQAIKSEIKAVKALGAKISKDEIKTIRERLERNEQRRIDKLQIKRNDLITHNSNNHFKSVVELPSNVQLPSNVIAVNFQKRA